MNDDQLEDLKQFIDSRISQTETRLDGKIGELDGKLGELDGRIGELDGKLGTLKAEMNQRFDEVQSAIAETIAISNDSADDQLKDHERRIAKLEQQTA